VEVWNALRLVHRASLHSPASSHSPLVLVNVGSAGARR
jgi:hypothetical protein